MESGPYTRRPGNLVIPWIDGVPFYERLAAALRAARNRVWAVVLLVACQARGVDVRALF